MGLGGGGGIGAHNSKPVNYKMVSIVQENCSGIRVACSPMLL